MKTIVVSNQRVDGSSPSYPVNNPHIYLWGLFVLEGIIVFDSNKLLAVHK